MGLIYAEIELINGEDMVLARRNIIGEDEVKRMPVNMLVDTGSVYMCINESIQDNWSSRCLNSVKANSLTATLLNIT
ncbi:MAG TPA: hypothetical protein VIM16_13455 [Mucilaginibacter sp.]|jgi:hypothetical protein